MDSDEKSEYSLYILRKNIFKIPCFKKTMFYSISSWVGVGLLTFLFTSRPTFASHCGFASYVVVSFGYFTHCRYKHMKDQIMMDQLEELIHKRNVLEGTDYDGNETDVQSKLEEA